MCTTRRADPVIAMFSLGGTIAATHSAAGGVVPGLTAEQLLAAVPGLDAVRARVERTTSGGFRVRR